MQFAHIARSMRLRFARDPMTTKMADHRVRPLDVGMPLENIIFI